LGVEVIDLGIARDVREQIEAALRRGAAEADVVLTSGGVSVGDFDLVKDVINELGAIDFWKVRMKPGKPQAHGRLGKAEFFGLPGNPVSVMATYLLLVRPALLKMMGADPGPQKEMRLPYRGAQICKSHDRAEFARGRVHFAGADTHVTSTGAQGSGILSSMAAANCFIMLGEAPVEVREGDLVTVIPIEY
ncbi:MAG TPA: molybdopterin molybdenumtransferase MoeA, partial [Aliiroseovarius sp.]|nr:molybdopterin molybdenumtransferase MoeA [Aliiroseovarius sp.]